MYHLCQNNLVLPLKHFNRNEPYRSFVSTATGDFSRSIFAIGVVGAFATGVEASVEFAIQAITAATAQKCISNGAVPIPSGTIAVGLAAAARRL